MKASKKFLGLIVAIGLIPIYLTYPLWTAYLKHNFASETIDLNRLITCDSPQKTTIKINSGKQLIVINDAYNKVEKVIGIEKKSQQISCEDRIRTIRIKGNSIIIKTGSDYIDTTSNDGLMFTKSGQLKLGRSAEVFLIVDESGYFKNS